MRKYPHQLAKTLFLDRHPVYRSVCPEGRHSNIHKLLRLSDACYAVIGQLVSGLSSSASLPRLYPYGLMSTAKDLDFTYKY